MNRRAALLAGLAAGSLTLAPASTAEEPRLYRWTDEQGVVRYTPDPSRIPGGAQDAVEVVAPEAAPEPGAEDAADAPEAPGALPAVMGRKLPEELVAPAAPPAEPTDLETRIAELREAIRRSREELQELVRGGDVEEAGREERIRVIANRLPELQAELARLESRRRGAPE